MIRCRQCSGFISNTVCGQRFPAALPAVDKWRLGMVLSFTYCTFCISTLFSWIRFHGSDPGTSRSHWLEICNPTEAVLIQHHALLTWKAPEKMCLVRREIIPEQTGCCNSSPLSTMKKKNFEVTWWQQDNGAQFGKYCDVSLVLIKEHFHIMRVNLYIFYLWAAFSRIFFLSASFSCQMRTKKTPPFIPYPAESSIIHNEFSRLWRKKNKKCWCKLHSVVSALMDCSVGKENISHN